MLLASPHIPEDNIISAEPFNIYTGILGQIGDIIGFTATVRRIKQLFPNSQITFAVSARYREAGELVAGLPYIDRLFVTELYLERLTEEKWAPWLLGWPVDLRGDDEIEEQRRHDIILETRPRHTCPTWWEQVHQVEEYARVVGVPGSINLNTEICIPEGTLPPPNTTGKIVLHNDPSIDPVKAWPWEHVEAFIRRIGPEQVVLLGNPGPPLPGVQDLRGCTTLAQAAAVIASARCFVGIDSGPMWIAGSLQVPTVGLYGTSYIPAFQSILPANPHAIYIQAEGSMDTIQPYLVLETLEQVISSIRL